ncbi:unnamed protein product [Sphenostylis stenocarpa]|uniref:Uncharacterized protein n=1 Tax=Sphenostylis stenocarpa TaxID=92480 RepID=A0AA86W5X3_9FABA|nr:unnamed protein product [Sphenostylis stenocarpa]
MYVVRKMEGQDDNTSFPFSHDIRMIRLVGPRDILDFVKVMLGWCLLVVHMWKNTVTDLHCGEGQRMKEMLAHKKEKKEFLSKIANHGVAFTTKAKEN